MIPLAMHPARQPDRLADVIRTKDGAGMRTITVRGRHRRFKGFNRFKGFERFRGIERFMTPDA
jgi:hypothetical protein